MSGFKIVQKQSLPNIPKNVVASVISKLQQGNQAGLTVNESNITVDKLNGGQLYLDTKTNDLRIIVPRFFPALGGIGNCRALSQSLELLYNAIAGSAYDTVSFNRADLGKHLFITEGFVLAMDMIDRYLDTFAIRQYGNIAPDMLLKAQRFSAYHNGNRVDYPTLQALRNQLVPLFDKLLIPSSIGWINKHRALVRHVYADDVHMKTQFIVCIPEYIYAQLQVGSDVVQPLSPSIWNANGRQSDLDIITFAELLVTKVQDYLDSAWFKDLSPYLWRAMCQENGPKIDKPITFSRREESVPNLELDVLFDYNVIQMIRNADYIGVPANARANSASGNYGNMWIEEDNEGNLRQGTYAINSNNQGTYGIIVAPLATLFVHGHNIAVTEKANSIGSINLLGDTNVKHAIYPCNTYMKYVNAEDFPSTDETLYYLMNASVRVGIQTFSGLAGQVHYIASSGDTIFTQLNLVFNISPSGNGVYVEEFLPYEFSCFDRLDIATIAAFSFTDTVVVISKTGIQLEDIYTLTESLNCCPLMGSVYIDADNEIAVKVKYVDKDNIVHVPAESLRFAHDYIMYSAMELGSRSGFEDSTNHSSNKNKRNKRKGKGDKDKKSPVEDKTK